MAGRYKKFGRRTTQKWTVVFLDLVNNDKNGIDSKFEHEILAGKTHSYPHLSNISRAKVYLALITQMNKKPFV
jgi:hypothetical protein